MFAFIIAIAAGFATPYARPFIEKGLQNVVLEELKFDSEDMRMISFIAMMLVAAILFAIMGHGSALGLIIGGTLGVFGNQIIAATKSLIEKNEKNEKKVDTDVDPEAEIEAAIEAEKDK